MTPDLDSLLRGADPARDDAVTDALLTRVRARVDAERTDLVPAGHRRSPWPRRTVLIAVAAAVLTAVPLVVAGQDDGSGGRSRLVPPAIAADGTIDCGAGYASVVLPADAPVRLLPDRLPDGWSYSSFMIRHDTRASTCIPPSLSVLRQDPTGVVTARITLTGPVDARLDLPEPVDEGVPDTVFGRAALRFDARLSQIGLRRWVWTDDQGQRWMAETSGMPVDEARQALTSVSIAGPQVSWNGAALPGWTVAHQRTGQPYAAPQEVTTWSIELADGVGTRRLEVDSTGPVALPLAAQAEVGDRLTTLSGSPAIVARPQGGEDEGGPPGSVPRTFVLVEPVPGTVALSFERGGDLAEIEDVLRSLRQVPADDPRLERYDAD